MFSLEAYRIYLMQDCEIKQRKTKKFELRDVNSKFLDEKSELWDKKTVTVYLFIYLCGGSNRIGSCKFRFASKVIITLVLHSGKIFLHTEFAHLQVRHMNLLHWSSEICLVWNWLPCESWFIRHYTLLTRVATND